ncbi:TAXI family TRAP transporter solute-binding subunit [Streptomyces sp. SCUT-3]|nr:TAXI family TRAP transporter solute-binding subunit [Streptomyces sp. SCUT-3]
MAGSGTVRPFLPASVARRTARPVAALVAAVTAVAAAAALLAWWSAPSAGTPVPEGPVTVATGVRSGVYERYGRMLKEDLRTDLPGVDVRLAPSAGSVENINMVASGRASFTLAAADAVADYRGAGRDRLRACARLYDDYLQLVVARSSTVRNARELRGLRVGVGQDGSGVNLIAERLLTAAGLHPTRDVEAVRVGIDRAPRMLEKGELDAFFWSGGLPTTAVSNLSQRFPIRLVQLGDLAEPLREQADGGRNHYRQAVMPGDAYPKAWPRGAAVPTVAVANLLVTTDRVDAALTEQVTRTVIDSRDRIGEQVHAAQLVDLRTAIYTDPLPLHEGARRYYRSVKP